MKTVALLLIGCLWLCVFGCSGIDARNDPTEDYVSVPLPLSEEISRVTVIVHGRNGLVHGKWFRSIDGTWENNIESPLGGKWAYGMVQEDVQPALDALHQIGDWKQVDEAFAKNLKANVTEDSSRFDALFVQTKTRSLVRVFARDHKVPNSEWGAFVSRFLGE